MGVCVLCNFLGLCTAPIGSEGRRRSREEEEEEALKRKQLQEEHLSKVSDEHKYTLLLLLIINLLLTTCISGGVSLNITSQMCICVYTIWMCVFVDSVWFRKAYSEGGDGKRTDQGTSRA